MNKGLGFRTMVDNIIRHKEKNGLLSISGLKGGSGSLAMPRKEEIMAAYYSYRNQKI